MFLTISFCQTLNWESGARTCERLKWHLYSSAGGCFSNHSQETKLWPGLSKLLQDTVDMDVQQDKDNRELRGHRDGLWDISLSLMSVMIKYPLNRNQRRDRKQNNVPEHTGEALLCRTVTHRRRHHRQNVRLIQQIQKHLQTGNTRGRQTPQVQTSLHIKSVLETKYIVSWIS